MRITKRTNIAVRVLMFCAAHPDRLVTKAEIAQRCHASENHLAQVVNQLAHAGYLHTQRGRNGGLSLGLDTREIVIGDVFRHFEHPIPTTECFADTDHTCPLVTACRLKVALADAANAFFKALDNVTLDALVCGNTELLDIFSTTSYGGAKNDPLRCNPDSVIPRE